MQKQILIFAHIPKTAGSWVNHVLRSSFGTAHCSRFIPREKERYFDLSDLEFALRVFPDIKSVSSHAVRDPARRLPGQKNCFSLVREPLARTASAYQYKVQKGLFADRRNAGSLEHFEHWIAQVENHDYQLRQIAGIASLQRAKQVVADSFFFVGLTEFLEESMNAFARLSPLPIDVSPRRSRGGDPYNRATDNSLSKRLLNDAYTHDLLAAANTRDSLFYRWVKQTCYPEYIDRARSMPPRSVDAPEALSFRRSKLFNNIIYSSVQRIRYRTRRTKFCHGPVW